MPNPCGYTHPKNQPCRLCEAAIARLKRSSEAERGPVKPKVVGSSPTASAKEKIDAALVQDPVALEAQKHESPVPDMDEPVETSPSKSDRLAVAKEALDGAERQKRHREKDPEAYKKWNRERMKARRAKIRGSPSE